MLTVILLPGMDGTGLQFKPFIDVLSGRFAVRVVRYPTIGNLGYNELEAIARTTLPTQEPFIIVGESFSGPIAISLAASRPVGLVGLVLCCTFARNPRPATTRLKSLTSWIPLGIAPGLIHETLMLGRFATAATRAMLAESLKQVAPDVLRHRLRAVMTVDFSAKLGAIQAPVLYLQATKDRLVPSSAVRVITTALPETRIVQLHAPHALLQTSPNEALQAIENFIVDRCGMKDE